MLLIKSNMIKIDAIEFHILSHVKYKSPSVSD